MTANPILLQKNMPGSLSDFRKRKILSFDEALKFFYCSALYPLLCEGVSDLHCMSDEYLTEELIFEYEET